MQKLINWITEAAMLKITPCVGSDAPSQLVAQRCGLHLCDKFKTYIKCYSTSVLSLFVQNTWKAKATMVTLHQCDSSITPTWLCLLKDTQRKCENEKIRIIWYKVASVLRQILATYILGVSAVYNVAHLIQASGNKLCWIWHQWNTKNNARAVKQDGPKSESLSYLLTWFLLGSKLEPIDATFSGKGF